MSPNEVFARLKARGVKLHGVAETPAAADPVVIVDDSAHPSREDEVSPAASGAQPEAGRSFDDAATERQSGEERGQVFRSDAMLRQRREALEEAEKCIRWHRRSWIDAGRALAKIQREQLYLDQTFESFETYVEQRHFISGRQAWNYIRAAMVANNVSAVKHALSLRSAVILGRLKAEKQGECLSKLIAKYGKSPSAKEMSEAVAAALGRQAKKRKAKPKESKPKLVREVRVAPDKVLTILANWPIDDLRTILQQVLIQLDTPNEPNEARAG